MRSIAGTRGKSGSRSRPPENGVARPAGIRPIQYLPSHTPFAELISYCTQGTSNPVLKAGHMQDHIAETIELHLDDIEKILWFPSPKHEGPTIRDLLDK